MFHPQESEAPSFDDLLRQFAGAYGEERQDQAWLLSDQDVLVLLTLITPGHQNHILNQ